MTEVAASYLDRQTYRQIPFDEVQLHPANARRGDVFEIVDSIRTLGWFGACGVQRSTGYLIWGNHRFQAALEARDLIAAALALEAAGAELDAEQRAWAAWPARFGGTLDELAVFDIDVDDTEALEILIRDNGSSDKATWDRPGLVGLLDEIAERRGGLATTGFRRAELEELRASIPPEPTEREAEDPELPAPPADPTTRTGDVWHLGRHLLICGDARHGDVYELLGPPDLLCTDPPYGVDIGAKNRFLSAHDKARRSLVDLEGDTDGDEAALWEAAFTAAHPYLRPGTPYYIFGPAGPLGAALVATLEAAGYGPRHVLVWDKEQPSFSLGRLDYDYQHETIVYGWAAGADEQRQARVVPGDDGTPILDWVDYGDQHETIVYGWRAGAAHPWHSLDPQTTILRYPRPKRSPEHPTMKPVPLLERLIANSTKRDGTVCDPFAGAGSTLIACEHLDRQARTVEKDPGFCDVICRRWQALTGYQPTRNGEAVDFLAG